MSTKRMSDEPQLARPSQILHYGTVLLDDNIDSNINGGGGKAWYVVLINWPYQVGKEGDHEQLIRRLPPLEEHHKGDACLGLRALIDDTC
ncbi:hypothetical protein H6P81_019498 [Aristolochia fimbriata]|uniref:Uncharacterized protein n=1 Tax=Aristolochia fimbriata TaxID=158543 RepID=A0AAV7DSU2_ARIFI|nr:hypothetical protein H6P81_019498 [Aristolochia fimbriata]